MLNATNFVRWLFVGERARSQRSPTEEREARGFVNNWIRLDRSARRTNCTGLRGEVSKFSSHRKSRCKWLMTIYLIQFQIGVSDWRTAAEEDKSAVDALSTRGGKDRRRAGAAIIPVGSETAISSVSSRWSTMYSPTVSPNTSLELEEICQKLFRLGRLVGRATNTGSRPNNSDGFFFHSNDSFSNWARCEPSQLRGALCA